MIGLGWEWAAIGTLISELIDTDAAKAAKDAISAEAAKHAKALWQRVEWDKAETTYRTRLLPVVSTTRLLGNSKPVNIDQLYTDLLVFSQPSALRRSAHIVDPNNDKRELVGETQERRNARDVVEKGSNLYLLGHPGAGKTTFLRYMAILGCKGVLSRVPVYVQLRDVARNYRLPSPGTGVEEAQREMRDLLGVAFREEFAACGFPDVGRFTDALFTNGRALVLIDGLDEVPSKDGMRAAIIDSIRAFQRRHPKVQICVTCRIAASEYTFEHFEYAEVAPFTVEQQISFLQRWFVEEPTKRERVLADWSNTRSRSLRDLGRTPLLLALICLAFDDIGELPERQIDLYREALEALFKRWDGSRAVFRDPFYGNLSPHRREQLAQEIASSLFEQDVITFGASEAQPIIENWFSRLPERMAPTESRIDGETVLLQLEAQHGVVIQRARGVYSFAHLSIQEFLTARSICEGHPQRTLEQLALKRALDVRWREVIVFCAGLLQDGTQFLESVVHAVNRLLNDSTELLSLVSQIHAMFLGGKVAPSLDEFLDSSNGTSLMPLRQATDLVRRLDALAWAGQQHALRIRVALLREHLLNVQAGRTTLYGDLAREGSALSKYLQGVGLLVDCTAVATCSTRDRIVSPLLANIRS